MAYFFPYPTRTSAGDHTDTRSKRPRQPSHHYLHLSELLQVKMKVLQFFWMGRRKV